MHLMYCAHQVRSIMIENIEKVLERGERLDLLVDKTEHLQGEAFAFNRQAARLKREMWWQVRAARACCGVGAPPRRCLRALWRRHSYAPSTMHACTRCTESHAAF